MGKDTIQLETAVSTISQEYLLEFTSEYDISEDVHHELPDPEERIVDFPKDMDLFNLISAPNTSKVKTGLRLRAAHEVPLLTATASRVIDMKDPNVATESSGTPSAIEKSSLDFDNENPSSQMTEGNGTEDQAHETVAPEILLPGNMPATGAARDTRLSKKRGRRANIRKDYASVRPKQSTRERKFLSTMGLATGSTFLTPADTKGVNNPDPSFEILTETVATMEVQDTRSAESAGSGKSTSSPSMVGSPGDIYQPGWGVTNSCRLDTSDAFQDVVDHIVPPGYFSELRHMPNAEFLSQYNKKLAQQVVMVSQLRLRFEQEVRLLKKARSQIARRDQMIQVREEEIKKLDQEIQKIICTQFLDLQVSHDQLTQQISTLQTQVTGEERIKAAFEEFKKHEDDRVEKRCADARLDALSINFDDELYPHMQTAIAGRRWVIGHDLRLAVMKCAKLIELRQAFANVMSARISKGKSEGVARVIEHGKAGRDLEGLKDASIEVIMASLHLESDSGEDASKLIRDLRPSTSQLKIHVYQEVRDSRDPWAVKEAVLLKEAIAANVSRAEKKKRCRVVCRTHGIGSAYHARSDGLPVSVSTVAPQGLAILLADAATQTETSEDDASPRLLKSKSLPPMYNLDWP
nr:hypothetical protein [Tanacetum cinerariifolium]